MKSQAVVVVHPRMLPFAPWLAAQIIIVQYCTDMEWNARHAAARCDATFLLRSDNGTDAHFAIYPDII